MGPHGKAVVRRFCCVAAGRKNWTFAGSYSARYISRTFLFLAEIRRFAG